MDRTFFVDEANWESITEQGFVLTSFKLAIPFTRDGEIPDVVRELWRHPALTGPWKELSSFGGPCDDYGVDLYGLITICGFEAIGCNSYLIPDIDDWLYLSVPYRMLKQVSTVKWPLIADTNPWLPALEQLLIEIGERIHKVCPYDIAYVGESTRGFTYVDGVLAYPKEVVEQGGFLVSSELWDQLELDSPNVELTSGMHWIPPVIRSENDPGSK